MLAVAAVSSTPGLDLWPAIERGGITFMLFLAVVGLFTGQVFSKKQADALLKMQQDRYETDTKRLEQRIQEEKARADRFESLLFQQVALANRVGAVAERVAEKVGG